MGEALIYHGTPLTPRAALEAVLPGRAACVSFYRPDDLEALLAICPQVMFRPRRVQLLDEGAACRPGMGRSGARPVVASLLPLAGADHLQSGPVGYHARQPRRSFTAQRWATQRLAVRAVEGGAGMAYGWSYRSARSSVRALSKGLRRVGWRPETGASRLPCLSPKDGRGWGAYGQCVAPAAHAARDGSCIRLSVHQRGQHLSRAERASLRLAGQSMVHVQRPASQMEGASLLRRSAGGRAQ